MSAYGRSGTSSSWKSAPSYRTSSEPGLLPRGIGVMSSSSRDVASMEFGTKPRGTDRSSCPDRDSVISRSGLRAATTTAVSPSTAALMAPSAAAGPVAG